MIFYGQCSLTSGLQSVIVKMDYILYVKEEGIEMMVQQVSDSELELMKLIWDNNGKILYAELMDQLKANGRRKDC